MNKPFSTQCYAKNNMPPGVGGGMKKNIKSKKKVITSKKKEKTTVTGNDAKADLDWGKIIVAFLTPWRNPNSIFLYMLIILNILGNMNPHVD